MPSTRLAAVSTRETRAALLSTALAYICAHASLAWMTQAATAPAFWLPSAAALAVLLWTPEARLRSVLPALLVGVLLARRSRFEPIDLDSVLQAGLQCLAVALAIGLMQPMAAARQWPVWLRFSGQLGTTILLAPALTAVLAALLANLRHAASFADTWLHWLNDTASGLAATLPLLLALRWPFRSQSALIPRRPAARRWGTAIAWSLYALVLGVAASRPTEVIVLAPLLSLAMLGSSVRAAAVLGSLVLLLQGSLGLLIGLPTPAWSGPQQLAWLFLILTTLALRSLIDELWTRHDQLGAARDFAESFLQSSSSLIVILDGTGQVVRINPACETLLGKSEAELRGRLWIDLLVPEAQRRGVWDEFKRVVSQQCSDSRYQNSIVAAGKQTREILWQNNPIRLPDGSIGTQSLGVDVTERLLAERAVQESERRYRTLFETSPDGVWISDLEGSIVDVNDRYLTRSGYTREALLGRRVTQVEADPDPYLIEQRRRRVLQSGLDHYETEHCQADGQRWWLEVHASRLPGEPPLIVAFMRDITERKRQALQIQQALQQQQTIAGRLRLALGAAGIGAWQRDLISGEVHWDARMREIYGIPTSRRISSVSDFVARIHPDDRAQVDLAYARAIAGAGPYHIRFRIIRDDGQLRHLESYADVERDAAQLPLRLSGVSLDITEQVCNRRRIEQEVRLKQDVLDTVRSILHSSRSPSEQLVDVLSLMIEHRQIQAGLGFRLRDSRFELIALRGLDALQLEPRLRLSEALTALQQTDPAWDAPIDLQTALPDLDPASSSHRGWQAYPLRSAGGPLLGALVLAPSQGGPLQGEALTLLQTLSHFLLLQWTSERLREDLRQQRDRLEELISSVEGVMWEAEPQAYTYRLVMGKAEALLGYPLADWYQEQFWLDKLHPDDQTWVPQHCLQQEQNGSNYDIEYRMLHAAGHEVWVRELVTVDPGSAGPAQRVRGLVIDITARVAREQQIAEQRERFQDLVDSTQGIVWESTGGGEQFSYVSAQAERLLGHPIDTCLGKGFWQRSLHPDDRERATDFRQRRIREGVNDRCDYRLIDANGATIWVRDVVSVVKKGDSVIGLRGVMIDITAERLAEARALNAMTRLQLALRAGGIGVWEVDLGTGAEVWDAQMYQLLGIAEDSDPAAVELLRSTLDQTDIASARQLAGRNASDTPTFEHEYSIRRLDDGALRRIRVQSALMRADSLAAPRLIGLTWDCTEQQQAASAMRERQAQLQQLVEKQTLSAVQAKQRAERAAALQAEFLANVSHELRTPLHAIMGFLDLAQEDLADSQGNDAALLDSAQQRIERSGSAARRLLHLVDDLLDLAKLESGRLDLLREPRSLLMVIETVLQELAPMLQARQVQISRHFDLAAPVVMIDERRIVQVFRNIIANALRYSPESSQISVRISLQPFRDRPAACVAIDDQGPGIPDSELESIFNKFVQSTATAKSAAGGTGLGLPIAREIMRAHGGDIQASNLSDGGARFQVCFPLT